MSLELASLGELTVREIKVTVGSRSSHSRHPFQLLYLSDLHLSFWTAHVCQQIEKAVKDLKSDVIILGGDLVETVFGLGQLTALVRFLQTKATVYALAGNHDYWVGMQRVQSAVEQGGGQWLSDQEIELKSARGRIVIAAEVQPSLTLNSYHILCAHDPAVFPLAVQKGYSLVLAGHLHGGQIVMKQQADVLYPGALIYKWNVLHQHVGKSDLYVSRGINDTVPIRYNCPREILLCSIF